MTAPLRVGDVLYGFCGGAFGRDHYGPCRVEAIGADWVVVRNDGTNATPDFSHRASPDDLTEYRDPIHDPLHEEATFPHG